MAGAPKDISARRPRRCCDQPIVNACEQHGGRPRGAKRQWPPSVVPIMMPSPTGEKEAKPLRALLNGRDRKQPATKDAKTAPVSEAELEEDQEQGTGADAIIGKGIERLEFVLVEVTHEKGDAEIGGDARDDTSD